HQDLFHRRRGVPATDHDRQYLWHELPGDAGTELGVRLSGGDRADVPVGLRPVLVFPAERLAVSALLVRPRTDCSSTEGATKPLWELACKRMYSGPKRFACRQAPTVDRVSGRQAPEIILAMGAAIFVQFDQMRLK